MKKLLMLGLLVSVSTGCGRGFFPHLFRGAPCGGLCSTAAPQGDAGCANCASSGYENYGAGDSMMNDAGIGPTPTTTYETIPPTMAPLPQGTIVSPRQ